MAPEILKELDKLSGISLENIQQLENDPDLSKALFVQEESGKKRLIVTLKNPKKSISMELWDCLERIGNEVGILWTCIPESQEEGFTSRYEEIACLFSKE